ncbi:hypothetical protein CC86DRAFT_370060 [Ophiobolus disseminans]|uniref:P-loop containing nucleoside triphosphate hydrolase protein n=1 Tax=Ophiobolus disseminans TaxID=1469910 RepID=A0A6A7A323_9PLEO|nr:hypothetical protein CC86DRAFT_370060 [Ophiobolus disseminans]
MSESMCTEAVRAIQEQNIVATQLQDSCLTDEDSEEDYESEMSGNDSSESLESSDDSLSSSELLANSPKGSLTPTTGPLDSWVHQEYSDHAFSLSGFIGYTKFNNMLFQKKPKQSKEIRATVLRLRESGHAYSLLHPDKMNLIKVAARKSEGAKLHKPHLGQYQQKKEPLLSETTLQRSRTPSVASLSRVSDAVRSGLDDFSVPECQIVIAEVPDFQLLAGLLRSKTKDTSKANAIAGPNRDISHAPLISGVMVAQHSRDLVPQYGLLGSLPVEDLASPSSQLFLNTNVPFSAFICGVQGSGKSHTTSCMMENAVIASPQLGCLRSLASTMVFSYGEWSGGGAGFSISEATFLAASNPALPGLHAKRVTVLTSPSNPAINKLYQRFPNVRIIPFRLKANSLDIGSLRTLMAVDDKATTPLYMSRVEAILRNIASNSQDGCLNYVEFKKRLDMENFDPTQRNMLDMRLNQLESFMDLTDKAKEPSFLPGEITIMDLSDAFMTPNTACILFKLGLERFLQSTASAKMVVLDEAHKYMLKTPGSKVLTDYLAKVIRLQRHFGARVIISTQEPTISTDLIALCSVTVIHRFTSPAWYAALRKHINAMDDDQATMRDIEGLETGEALVYAPNAVLGKHDDGTLVKATGRLLKLNIRDRVTLDGGESIMAV